MASAGPPELRTAMLAILKKAPLARVDYLKIVDGSTLESTRSASKERSLP